MNDYLPPWIAHPAVQKLAIALAGIVIILVIARSLGRALSRRVKDKDVRYRARKFVGFFGFLCVVLLLTVLFSDQLGGLGVALGVAGAGIAFALQEVIASLAGWFAVSFGHFYKTGDRVQLGGIKGDVIDIGILRTTLMECGDWVRGDAYNGRVVRVANSFVFKEPVFNYSGDFPFLWDEITVPIKYGSDRPMTRALLHRVLNEVVGGYSAQAREAWQELVRKYLIEDASVEPMVTMVANDNWMEFTLRYTVDYKQRRATRDRLFSRLLDEIDQTGGRVALASATFQLVEPPVFDVRLAPAATNAVPKAGGPANDSTGSA